MSHLLKHLNYTACPTCGSGIRSEEFTGRIHCNGQQFENITFLCGCLIDWVPNFGREEVSRTCPTSEQAKKKTLRREEIRAAILNAVLPLNLSPEEQEKIDRFIRYEWT